MEVKYPVNTNNHTTNYAPDYTQQGDNPSSNVP